MADDGLHRLELNLRPNEASGLLAVEDEPLLEAHGWDLGFWAVLDEGEIEDCVAVIGHRRGTNIGEGWEIERLRAEPIGDAGKTEDAEAVTRRDGWIYIFGSHFGGKHGPLQPKEASSPASARPRSGTRREIRDGDGDRARWLPAAPPDQRRPEERWSRPGPARTELPQSLIEATIERIQNTRWAGLVREDDYPINIEGAAFRESGTLLLGLRFPVSAEGYPVLVELEGIDRLLEPGDSLPEVRGFWVVDAVGREGDIAGVRDLAILSTERGEELHLVTGNVDSRDKESVLIQDYPGGQNTVATHFRSTLPPEDHSGALKGEFVREFPDLPRVEGIAIRGWPLLLRHRRGRGRPPAAHPSPGGLARASRGA